MPVNKTNSDIRQAIKDIEIHLEMLLTDDMKRHAYISDEHDLSFKIFRLLGGYDQALEFIKKIINEGKINLDNYKGYELNKQKQVMFVEDSLKEQDINNSTKMMNDTIDYCKENNITLDDFLGGN